MAECKDIQQGKMIVAITNQYWVKYVYIQVSRFGRVWLFDINNQRLYEWSGGKMCEFPSARKRGTANIQGRLMMKISICFVKY